MNYLKSIFNKIRNIACAFLVICFVSQNFWASDLLFIGKKENSNSSELFQFACEYYGLNHDCFFLNSNEKKLQDLYEYKDNELRGVVLSADCFSHNKNTKNLSHEFFQNFFNKNIPFFIMKISKRTNKEEIAGLTKIILSGYDDQNIPISKAAVKFTHKKKYAFQFSGLKYNTKKKYIKGFLIIKNYRFEPIISFVDEKEDQIYPIFVRTETNGQEVFFLAENKNDMPITNEILPLLFFLRYICNQQCWHASGHFANLSIDDPWLTEPYGHLKYSKLCNNNIKNFHTTIGFTPWNYDRSEPEVVNLFKKHPDKLSICIHGNNHDHYEFYKYETGTLDVWPEKSLSVQEANITQALARMEKHKELTGLNYDKVMIFPHAIAPEKTLKLLKKYNFLATINEDKIPLDSKVPKNPLFRLKAVTLRYGNFPSFRRYQPDRNEFQIALDLFLGNPLLFFSHHNYFRKGMDAFDHIVEKVESMEPDVNWQSLGYITKHYYLERLREDGNYDVMAFTNNLVIKNNYKRNITYYVQKEEDFSIPIEQVMVDGEQSSYKKTDDKILVEIIIPQGQSREIFIRYKNDLDINAIDVSKNDPRINRLRKISDFRDITLSQNFLGRIIIDIYYNTGLYRWGIKKTIITFSVVFVLAISLFAGFFYIRHRKKRADP